MNFFAWLLNLFVYICYLIISIVVFNTAIDIHTVYTPHLQPSTLCTELRSRLHELRSCLRGSTVDNWTTLMSEHSIASSTPLRQINKNIDGNKENLGAGCAKPTLHDVRAPTPRYGAGDQRLRESQCNVMLHSTPLCLTKSMKLAQYTERNVTQDSGIECTKSSPISENRIHCSHSMRPLAPSNSNYALKNRQSQMSRSYKLTRVGRLENGRIKTINSSKCSSADSTQVNDESSVWRPYLDWNPESARRGSTK